jgi:hypothetical protein
MSEKRKVRTKSVSEAVAEEGKGHDDKPKRKKSAMKSARELTIHLNKPSGESYVINASEDLSYFELEKVLKKHFGDKVSSKADKPWAVFVVSDESGGEFDCSGRTPIRAHLSTHVDNIGCLADIATDLQPYATDKQLIDEGVKFRYVYKVRDDSSAPSSRKTSPRLERRASSTSGDAKAAAAPESPRKKKSADKAAAADDALRRRRSKDVSGDDGALERKSSRKGSKIVDAPLEPPDDGKPARQRKEKGGSKIREAAAVVTHANNNNTTTDDGDDDVKPTITVHTDLVEEARRKAEQETAEIQRQTKARVRRVCACVHVCGCNVTHVVDGCGDALRAHRDTGAASDAFGECVITTSLPSLCMWQSMQNDRMSSALSEQARLREEIRVRNEARLAKRTERIDKV